MLRWFEHLEAGHPIPVNVANAVMLTIVVWWATGLIELGVIVGVVVAFLRVRAWRDGGGFRVRYEEKYGSADGEEKP